MHLRLVPTTLAIVLCGSICSIGLAQTQPKQDSIEALAKALAERIVANAEERPRVTVLDFTDIQNRADELGRLLALQLAHELVMLRNIAVLDRANLETIMAEHQLTAEGLLRPEDAKKLGQFAGVDAILLGNLSLIGNDVELFVRAISTETSEIVASGRATLAATDDLRRMLTGRVDTSALASPRGSGATAIEGEAIAVREVGPITAILRNVTKHSVQSGQTTVPAIRCTFDLENRSLHRSVAVAANQSAKGGHYSGPAVDGYRGDLSDSNHVSWKLVEVRGVSAVLCFDRSYMYTGQKNPGAIVHYIRTARKYDGVFPRKDHGKYWSGSCSSIAPGETVRMTVDCVPSSMAGQRSPVRSEPVAMPAHFQFDMELVLGTFAEGEDPIKAKDLMLRNLTIDRVVLPP